MLEREDLVAIAREAGALLRGFFGRVVAIQKADKTLVSEADRATEELILSRVRALAPELPIMAEESFAKGSRPKQTDSPWLFAIDPLDGTNAFLSGLPIWGISLGLLFHGEPFRGVLYFPMVDELYEADETGAWWQGKALSDQPFVSPGSLAHASMCMPSSLHRLFSVDFVGKNRNFGSTAYHLGLVARGAVVGTLLEGVRLWDLVGGMALCKQTKRIAQSLDGKDFSMEPLLDGSVLSAPLLIADASSMSALLSTISSRSCD
ncbi:MAG: inositol monophosphatase [Myxococcales bacterium]|nr:inositol monophosphatase [Myxococcales bacterium]